jgi:hypothetical protein
VAAAAVCSTVWSLLGLSRIGPELANSGRQPANRHSVPASPDPPCGDLITAQSRAPPSQFRSRRSCSLLLAAIVRESPDPTIVRVDAPTDLDAPGNDGLTRCESREHVWRRKGYRDRTGVREMFKNQGRFPVNSPSMRLALAVFGGVMNGRRLLWRTRRPGCIRVSIWDGQIGDPVQVAEAERRAEDWLSPHR